MDKNLRNADVLLSATFAGGQPPPTGQGPRQQRSAAVQTPASSSSYGPQHFHKRPGRPPTNRPQPHQRQPQQQQRPQRQPEYRSMKSEDVAEVTVSSLSPDLTEDMLLSEFRVFGEIRSAEVRKKGDVSFGSLNFARRDDAKRAVLEMDGQVLGRGEIKVTLKQTAELTVNFLPPETTPTQLAKLFEEHGEVVRAGILYDKLVHDLPTGSGYVQFKDRQEAENAMERLDGAEMLEGHGVIRVVWSPESRPTGFDVVVESTLDADAKAVKRGLQRFGQIQSVRVRYDNVGRPFGMARVTFQTQEEAQRLRTEFGGLYLPEKKFFRVTLPQGYAEREMGAKNSADVVPKPEPQVKQPADKARAFEEAIAPKPDERAYTFRDPATKRNRRLIEFRLYAAPLKDRKKRMRELILDDKRSGFRIFLHPIVILINDPQERHQVGKWLAENKCEVFGFDYPDKNLVENDNEDDGFPLTVAAPSDGEYREGYEQLIFYHLSEEVKRIQDQPELVEFPKGTARVRVTAFYDAANPSECALVNRILLGADDVGD